MSRLGTPSWRLGRPDGPPVQLGTVLDPYGRGPTPVVVSTQSGARVARSGDIVFDDVNPVGVVIDGRGEISFSGDVRGHLREVLSQSGRQTSSFIPSGYVGWAHLASGATLSGQIATGPLPGYNIASGVLAAPPVVCVRCGKVVSHVYATTGLSMGTWVNVVVGHNLRLSYCSACAGFDCDRRDFTRREDWIRDSVPLASGTPDAVIADWCEERGRQADADWLRQLLDRR